MADLKGNIGSSIFDVLTSNYRIVSMRCIVMRFATRLAGVLVLLATMALTVTTASATHLSNPKTVSCNAQTHDVTVTIVVFGGANDSGNSNTEYVSINGTGVDEIDFGYGIPDGTYSRTVHLDAAVPGAQVSVSDGDTTVSTTCGDFFSGPAIPSSFQLRSVTCNTPVYSQPAGTPVSGTDITAGQTWYVSPTPVMAADGTSWTEIFTSSSPDGFIPTSCVG
jgi:hypothetical protein